MFYSFNLLIKSDGPFAVVWRLAHDRMKKVSRDDVLALDIRAKCEALERYLPTGQFTAAEVRNKMSLYLLAVLQYGIVVAHARKTDFVLRDLKAAFSMMHPSFLKQDKAQKRTSTGGGGGPTRRKRPRRSNVMQAIEEENDEEEQEADVALNLNIPDLPDARPSPHVRDIRDITLLESDAQPIHDFGFENPNIDDFLNMMELASNQGSEHSRNAFDNAQGNETSRMPEDMVALLEELESGIDFTMATLEPHHRREIDLTNTIQNMGDDEDRGSLVCPDRDVHMEDVDQEPVPLNLDLVVEPMDDNNTNTDTFHLPTLTTEELEQAEEEARVAEARNPRARRPRERHLIVDEETEITDLQMRRNLQSTEDICVARPAPLPIKPLPTVDELFAAFPIYIPYSREEFRGFFDAATDAALERVRDRQSHARSDLIDDVQEMALERTVVDEQPVDPMFSTDEAIVNEPPIALPDVTAEEIARRSMMPQHDFSLDARAPDVPAIRDLVYNDTEPNATENPPFFDEVLEEPLDQNVYEVLDVTLPPPPSPLGDLDEAANGLLHRIQRQKGSATSIVFENVCGRSKTERARDFSNLLVLLKHRKFKAQQSTAYGPIVVI